MDESKLIFKQLRPYVGKLIRGIDSLAIANGGKGAHHKACERALEVLMSNLKRMSEGVR